MRRLSLIAMSSPAAVIPVDPAVTRERSITVCSSMRAPISARTTDRRSTFGPLTEVASPSNTPVVFFPGSSATRESSSTPPPRTSAP
jgi:hypothetical protein